MILCPGAEILMSFLFNRWPSSTRAHPCLCSHSLSPRQAPTTTTPPSRSSPSSPSCTCASVPITPYLSEFSVLIQQLYLKINLLITLFSLKSYSTGYCKYSSSFFLQFSYMYIQSASVELLLPRLQPSEWRVHAPFLWSITLQVKLVLKQQKYLISA